LIVNIQATGANKQKAAFFAEIAHAFEFLALFHSLPVEDQKELLQIIVKFKANLS